MKKLALLILVCFSCSPKSGFYTFFEEQVPVADQAIDLPKWLPMMAIPDEAKNDIKLFTKGMKRVKLLRYKKNVSIGISHLEDYKEANGLEQYLAIKNQDFDLDLISKETEAVFKEIIISYVDNDAYYIFGMTGKMKKTDFEKAIATANDKNESQRK